MNAMEMGLSDTILCTGELDVTRKEAWPFYRTIFGVLLWKEPVEPKGPKGSQVWGMAVFISKT